MEMSAPPNYNWNGINDTLPEYVAFRGNRYIIGYRPDKRAIFAHKRDGTLWVKPNRNDPNWKRRRPVPTFAEDDSDDETPAMAAVAAVATSATEDCAPAQLFGRNSAVYHAPKGSSEQSE